MRALIPYLAVLLALIASGSIAYIAWDLTRPDEGDPTTDDDEDEESS